MILAIGFIINIPYILLNMVIDLNVDLIQMIKFVFNIFHTTAITILTVNFINHKSITLKSIFTRTFSKFGSVLGTCILAAIFALLWSLLLIIPGIIYMITCTFIVPIVVIKNYRWRAAIKYSKATGSGHWAGIVGAVISIGILNLICTVPAALHPENILFLLLLMISVFVISPFTYIVITVFFINLDSINNIPIEENQETVNKINLNKTISENTTHPVEIQ